jgi:hypothetical protein
MQGQDAGACGRLADDWRGDVCVQSFVRGFIDRVGRVLYPAGRGARDLLSGRIQGMAVQQAADDVIRHALEALHGDGGLIALTPDGQTAFSFNTPGMFRARLSEGGKLEVHMYKDEQ